jgi:hypothetical protein
MTENIHIPFKNKMLYSLLIMLAWAISLILPMWKFEPIQYSLLNDKTYTLFNDFAFMQRYSFHLNLVLISGPVFCISAFINTKKLIPLLFGSFIITMFIGGLGFYFSDRVALMWGWYAYGAGVLIINTAIATKLFPGLYEQQVSKNQVVEEKEEELSEEDDEIDEDLMEYKQLEDSDEIQTPSDGEEFFLSIYTKLFREIYSNEQISEKFKEDYLLKTLRKNLQFLDITTETSEEIEKIIALLADELIEKALKIAKEQKEIAASSPSCKIYSNSGPGGPTEVGKFERGIIYSTNRTPGKYYSGPTEVGFIERDSIYSTNRIPGKFYIGPTKVGFIERDIIYSTSAFGGSARQVGKIDGGKVYSTSASGGSARQVGKYDGGSACGAAAAYLLLF